METALIVGSLNAVLAPKPRKAIRALVAMKVIISTKQIIAHYALWHPKDVQCVNLMLIVIPFARNASIKLISSIKARIHV